MEVADDAPVMIWATEPDGRCSYLSRSWYRFTGQTPEVGLGYGWLDAVHPDDRPAAERIFLEANAVQASFQIEYRLRGGDGAYRWALDFAAPRSRHGAFAGYVGAVVDITDRKAAEDALAEREARFRAVLYGIDEGYCVCELILDGDGRPVDYRFLEVNDRFEAMTGLESAVGRTALELVPGLEPYWVETYGRVALGGRPERFELPSDAMGRWFDVFATPVEPRPCFALVFKDITRRVRLEHAERRAREQAELLAEMGSELEAAEDFDGRAARLVELLVPRLADVAAIEGVAGALPASGVHSEITVPIELGLARPGTLRLGLTEPARLPYSGEDEAIVGKLADRAGVFLARSRRRDVEHQAALELQRALLPGDLVRHERLEVAARYEAGSDLLEVGGDWYDTFTLPSGRIGFVVGDVVGHGLEAAAAMGRMRTALVALAPHADGPGMLLSHLDAYAVGSSSPGFATACCAVLDPATGQLCLASAGHPPILHVRADGTRAWLEDGRSAPLFGQPGAQRPQAALTLAAGDLLVLYSDGLVERRGEPIDAGMERVETVVGAARAEPVEVICDRLLAELGVADRRDDDVAILCVRFS